MNRRGFFSGAVAAVVALLGWGKASPLCAAKKPVEWITRGPGPAWTCFPGLSYAEWNTDDIVLKPGKIRRCISGFVRMRPGCQCPDVLPVPPVEAGFHRRLLVTNFDVFKNEFHFQTSDYTGPAPNNRSITFDGKTWASREHPPCA